MIFKCPGAQSFMQPKPENIRCSFCGGEVEIWTDEVNVTCPRCKKTVIREEGHQSCLDWCKYARECAGEEVYEKYMKNKKISVKYKETKQ